ncbi:uncharacterized protein LOC119728895 [Patiria miniata]|uniref:Uncharacterized protein n=1 Tax=Patiria miniata TaxID=46514 RepID=A0A914A0A5_PATMI|nr:uncharacterized protein LOC119728895 [Patiria miniata]
MPFSPSSNKASNVKMVVQCEECLKWRVCYAARVLKQDQKQQLELELDTLSYSCGAYFQDIDTGGDDDSVFNHIYVNDKLTCDMPIEAAYFVTFSDPLCFYCGSEHNLEANDGQDPLCDICKASGKQPHSKNTRAFVPR